MLAAVVLCACGGSTSTGGTGGAGGSGAAGGSGGSSGSGGSGGSGGTSPVGCPPTQPSGQACSVDPAVRCTYGDDVRPSCRNDYFCIGGHWTTTKNLCLQPPPGTCGGAPPAAGTVCTPDGAACGYSDGTICVCSLCPGGPCMQPPAKWTCTPPPTTPGCPATVPNDGTKCDAPGTSCTYGTPCAGEGAFVECTGGAWRWRTDIACPV